MRGAPPRRIAWHDRGPRRRSPVRAHRGRRINHGAAAEEGPAATAPTGLLRAQREVKSASHSHSQPPPRSRAREDAAACRHLYV
ncbi:hypothetical protein HPB50_006896 [Hyalomma asiaticum]|uniref:Uncharacterized protein n=1 Tax=Hyalomma asiaticum TaxID=266040 RepID=A0ACB7RYH6_HYAAI|nr:hypothetical protein HPB50_006896 [Hyalomma asiaticum]